MDGGEISIFSYRSAFTLVSKIQEEVHRFSIAYSRSKHQKMGFALTLTTVPGVGKTRAQKLFAHFKTVKAMREATLQQLEQAPGMTKPVAQALYAFLHPTEEAGQPEEQSVSGEQGQSQ